MIAAKDAPRISTVAVLLAWTLTPACNSRVEEPPQREPVFLPGPRHGHRIEQIHGGLLCFGGFGDPSVPDREARQTWWLGPGTQPWQRRADMNREHAFFASVAVDDVAYAIGDGIERYDFSADRWNEFVPHGELPTSHFSAAAVGKTLYVLGGVSSTGPESMLTVDLNSGAVQAAAAPPSYKRGDHFHFLVALEGRLHVIGGLDGATFEPRKEHWILTDSGWSALPPPPTGLWAKFALEATFDKKLYLFGEFGAWCFDPSAATWTTRAKMPQLLVMPQAAAIDGSLWVIGGMPVEGERGPLLYRYDIAKDAWFEGNAPKNK